MAIRSTAARRRSLSPPTKRATMSAGRVTPEEFLVPDDQVDELTANVLFRIAYVGVETGSLGSSRRRPGPLEDPLDLHPIPGPAPARGVAVGVEPDGDRPVGEPPARNSATIGTRSA